MTCPHPLQPARKCRDRSVSDGSPGDDAATPPGTMETWGTKGPAVTMTMPARCSPARPTPMDRRLRQGPDRPGLERGRGAALRLAGRGDAGPQGADRARGADRRAQRGSGARPHGRQVSLRTKRLHRDGSLLDVRVDTSALRSESGGGRLRLRLPPGPDDEAADEPDGAPGQAGAAAHRRGRRHQRRAGAARRARPDRGQPHRADRRRRGRVRAASRGSGCGWSAPYQLPRIAAGHHRRPARTSLVGKLLRTGRTVLLEIGTRTAGRAWCGPS